MQKKRKTHRLPEFMPRVKSSVSLLAAFLAACFLSGVPIGATDETVAPAVDIRECPVRFRDLPARIDPGGLQRVRLVASDETTETIRVLKPSTSGLFVIKTDSTIGDPLQGIYRMSSVRAASYRLSDGLGALTWQPVAERVARLEWEVKPGTYRLILRYLALGQDTIPEDKEDVTDVLVCLAISSPFELNSSFFLFRFEGES